MHGMLPDFMQCLVFALIQLLTSYLKSSFLFETTFIFPQHSPSREVCMIYQACYWLSAYLLPFVGVSTLCGFVPGTSYLMAIKIQNFKRYLRCASMENLFKNRIFAISIKNCTLQLNFKALFPVIKIRLINAKSQIQPKWCHLLPENFPKSKLSTIISGWYLHISKN